MPELSDVDLRLIDDIVWNIVHAPGALQQIGNFTSGEQLRAYLVRIAEQKIQTTTQFGPFGSQPTQEGQTAIEAFDTIVGQFLPQIGDLRFTQIGDTNRSMIQEYVQELDRDGKIIFEGYKRVGTKAYEVDELDELENAMTAAQAGNLAAREAELAESRRQFDIGETRRGQEFGQSFELQREQFKEKVRQNLQDLQVDLANVQSEAQRQRLAASARALPSGMEFVPGLQPGGPRAQTSRILGAEFTPRGREFTTSFDPDAAANTLAGSLARLGR
jgi:hypothetical protein